MYKTSKYNYFVNHKDRVIAFNGLSGHNFSLSKKESDFFQNQLKDLIAFEILYPSVFKKFKEWGYIVDNPDDELEKIRFRNKNEVFLNRDYHLVINPTLDCNFNCWYCYEKHDKAFMTPETIERIKKHVKQRVDKKEITGIHLAWFGGEPLLYFNEVVYPISIYMKDLMEENNLAYSSSITTNGYLISAENIEKIKEIQLHSYQITLDGDKDRHDKIRNIEGQPTFNTIMNNVNLLCENIPDVYITLRINYDEKTLKKSNFRKVFENIKPDHRKRIRPNFQRVWQTFNLTNKNKENKERIELHNMCRDLGFNVVSVSNAFSINKGTKCYVDQYFHTELNYDGSAYKCTARDYSEQYKVGELQEDGFLKYDQQKIARMFNKACFENEMCLPCKHLPICNGPCTQKIIETPKEELSNICALKNDEVSVESFIIDLYENKMKNLKDELII